MENDKRKVAIIGTGQVGMACAYALLNQNACDEILLVDINEKRALGEALDLAHGLAFSPSAMQINAGGYDQCRDADIAICCAGVAQREGETRLDLLKRNADVYKQVVAQLLSAGFGGIFLVAVNPVDVITRIIFDLSGFPATRVFGSGTTLDTARLRFLLGQQFSINPQNVHAYVIGEHGDTEFVPWSQAMLGTTPVTDLLGEKSCMEDLQAIEEKVRKSAYEIIALKGATSYAIGMALTRIVRAIFGDEHTLLTVSARLDGAYGQQDVFIGSPCVVGRSGILRVHELSLCPEERKQFIHSCTTLDDAYKGVHAR